MKRLEPPRASGPMQLGEITPIMQLAPPRRHGIPTTYRGVRFRSRHEAAWAAFFDELSLRWSYEPTDLNGYIPDFDLLFSKRPLLVEVKPLEEDVELAKSKIECSGWDGDSAIVVSGESRFVGWMYEPDFGWDPCVLTFCTACSRPTLVSESGTWRCRNCRAESRSLWWAFDAAELWARAKNAVQWRAA